MLNILFNMKKVSVRQIVHGFAKLHESLKPGQSVAITSHGLPIGQYIKRPPAASKCRISIKRRAKTGMAPKSVTPFLNGCSRTKNETISHTGFFATLLLETSAAAWPGRSPGG